MEGTNLRLGRVVGILAMLMAGPVTWACSSSEFISGGPLDLQVSSNSPVSVGDSLRLDYDVIGRSLLGLVVIWGDAERDSIFFFGAQTAGGHIAHLYPSDGSFTIMVQVQDQIDGSEMTDLTVTVDP